MSLYPSLLRPCPWSGLLLLFLLPLLPDTSLCITVPKKSPGHISILSHFNTTEVNCSKACQDNPKCQAREQYVFWRSICFLISCSNTSSCEDIPVDVLEQLAGDGGIYDNNRTAVKEFLDSSSRALTKFQQQTNNPSTSSSNQIERLAAPEQNNTHKSLNVSNSPLQSSTSSTSADGKNGNNDQKDPLLLQGNSSSLSLSSSKDAPVKPTPPTPSIISNRLPSQSATTLPPPKNSDSTSVSHLDGASHASSEDIDISANTSTAVEPGSNATTETISPGQGTAAISNTTAPITTTIAIKPPPPATTPAAAAATTPTTTTPPTSTPPTSTTTTTTPPPTPPPPTTTAITKTTTSTTKITPTKVATTVAIVTTPVAKKPSLTSPPSTQEPKVPITVIPPVRSPSAPPIGATTTATITTTTTTSTTSTPVDHNKQVVASGTGVAVDKVDRSALTSQLVDTASLLAVLLFGLLFFLVTVAVFVTQAYESYRRKDYTQVDYLINGMYTDSGV
ncbi:uncharacterized protein C11orf24 homolog [Polymixia lowei]